MFELGLTNHWDGFMLGITEIIVSVPIYNEVSSLSLTGDSIPVLLSVGGTYVHIICSHFTMQNLFCLLHNVLSPICINMLNCKCFGSNLNKGCF